MPFFSILLPSRNRLDLLKLSIRSVREQDFDDFEVIVSDNASSEDYGGYVASLFDARLKCFRTEEPLSVTDNWNRALKAASGSYVLMLGDDDALSPGLLRRLHALIERESNPCVIYMMAYHYLYPGVNPAAAEGYLLEVANSTLFVDKPHPYRLDPPEAMEFARSAVAFRHMISFNAQHYVWRRDFTKTKRDFFQPPYPDYFASFYTFSQADSIVVLPTASIIIGIAKQSFGFFFINNEQDAGTAFFLGTSDVDPRWEIEGDALDALAFPGSVHYRNWLLTSLRFKNETDATFEIDTDRYRRIQIVETIADAFCRGPTPPHNDREEWVGYESFVAEVRAAFQSATSDVGDESRLSSVNAEKMRIITHGLHVYFPAQVNEHPLKDHKDIMDAFAYLMENPNARWPTRQRRKASTLQLIVSSLMSRVRCLR